MKMPVFLKSGAKGGQAGFSLVELMIVVAIIGILAAIAVPKFSTFQAKSRQAEAKGNLSQIYTLEEAYFGDNESYVGFATVKENTCGANVIGFQLRPCNKGQVRYEYSGVAPTTLTYTITATTGLTNKVFPGCATADTWTINEQKQMDNTSNALSACN
jgi:prepilin-type N-terminal cleavage/methylation domain-containing protein